MIEVLPTRNEYATLTYKYFFLSISCTETLLRSRGSSAFRVVEVGLCHPSLRRQSQLRSRRFLRPQPRHFLQRPRRIDAKLEKVNHIFFFNLTVDYMERVHNNQVITCRSRMRTVQLERRTFTSTGVLVKEIF